MPPEQASGDWELVDARSDIWALGATMFTLLTGREVHEEATVQRVLVAAVTDDAPPLASQRPELPPALCAIVDRALARKREDRWQSARQMREALLELPGAEAQTQPEIRLPWIGDEPETTTFDRPQLPSMVSNAPTLDRATAARVPSSDAPRRRGSRIALWLTLSAAAVGLSLLYVSGSPDEAPPSAAPPLSPETSVEEPTPAASVALSSSAPSATATSAASAPSATPKVRRPPPPAKTPDPFNRWD
jgi:serine/threonine-protein kinase